MESNLLSHGIISILEDSIKSKISSEILVLIESIGFKFDKIYVGFEDLVLYRYKNWIVKIKIDEIHTQVFYYLELHEDNNPFWAIDYTEDIKYFKKEFIKYFSKEARKYKITNIING